MAGIGKIVKRRDAEVIKSLREHLAEAFVDWTIPGRPSRALLDASGQPSPLKAMDVFRKLRSPQAFDRLIAQVSAERHEPSGIIEQFTASLEGFRSLGGKDDVLCMYRVNEPGRDEHRGWVWLSPGFRVVSIRHVE